MASSQSVPGSDADDQLTPAQRYAASRQRTRSARSELTTFAATLGFDLDDFQRESCEALEAGRGVLVAAPTGAGKTVVAEFAVHLAITGGTKAFYTTPIKALSNQKYTELVARYGAANVGLLTGDTSVNGDAPVVVMTTEVLRNMLYAGSPALTGLGFVVMDEVHYLADRMRGAVWEEVIIHLARDVRVVSLSATVSNAEEFGAWLDTVRGDTAIVVSEHRPVPLWQHVLHGRTLYDLFTDGVPDAGVNPELVQLARDDARRSRLDRDDRNGRRPHRGGRQGRGGQGRGGRGGGPPRGGGHTGRPPGPSRADVISRLDADGLLPAITFIFSRAGCDAAVQQCITRGIRLTTPDQRDRIRRIVDERCQDLPAEDLGVLGFWGWRDGLERGLAAHHAGLLPTFKEVVEELFVAGLVRAVFATETLSLGINAPARSVVLEKLVKWNGQGHVEVTPGEYTQLTGRAGRRGIDVEGHAVVLWSPGTDPEAVAGLASTRTYPLRSSFRPTYNMAVNLVGTTGRPRAREILETSFAQFQADRAVVGLAADVRRRREALDGYAEAMTCHLGDFAEYAELRRQVSAREKDLSREHTRERRTEVVRSLERLRRGDAVQVPSGRRPGMAVVVDAGDGGGLDGPRPTLLTADKQVRTLGVGDLTGPVRVVGTVRIPPSFDPRKPRARADLASSLRAALAEGRRGDGTDQGPDESRGRASGEDTTLARLRTRLRAHPCHGCSDREDHARWAQRWQQLDRETAGVERRIEGRTASVARTFDRVCDLLTELDYLADDQVTPAGNRLRRLYSELDLVVAQCLRDGSWDGLDGAGLAVCAAAVVYQSRREPDAAPRVPVGRVGQALEDTIAQWSRVEELERRHKVSPSPRPDLGLAWPMHRWAQGARLDEVLEEADLAAGDFVRWCKQVVDLLGQVGAAAAAGGDTELRRTAEDAVDRVRRGVVAYSSLT